eukprot:g2851.t1
MGADMISRHEAAILWEWQQLDEQDRRIVFANRSNKRKIVVKFKGLAQFNCEDGLREAGQRIRMGREVSGMSKIERWFGGDTLPDRLALALARRRAIDMKEFVESFEFFTHARRKKYQVSSTIADMCCGHGFTGMLWAVFERKVKQVFLIDFKRPDSYDLIREAVCEVAPWAADKISFVEMNLQELVSNPSAHLPLRTSIFGVHACGDATDMCIEVGVKLGSLIAVMPCCYKPAPPPTPPVLELELGKELASDINRSYHLTSSGYSVEWQHYIDGKLVDVKCAVPRIDPESYIPYRGGAVVRNGHSHHHPLPPPPLPNAHPMSRMATSCAPEDFAMAEQAYHRKLKKVRAQYDTIHDEFMTAQAARSQKVGAIGSPGSHGRSHNTGATPHLVNRYSAFCQQQLYDILATLVCEMERVQVVLAKADTDAQMRTELEGLLSRMAFTATGLYKANDQIKLTQAFDHLDDYFGQNITDAHEQVSDSVGWWQWAKSQCTGGIAAVDAIYNLQAQQQQQQISSPPQLSPPQPSP